MAGTRCISRRRFLPGPPTRCAATLYSLGVRLYGLNTAPTRSPARRSRSCERATARSFGAFACAPEIPRRFVPRVRARLSRSGQRFRAPAHGAGAGRLAGRHSRLGRACGCCRPLAATGATDEVAAGGGRDRVGADLGPAVAVHLLAPVATKTRGCGSIAGNAKCCALPQMIRDQQSVDRSTEGRCIPPRLPSSGRYADHGRAITRLTSGVVHSGPT